MPFKVSLFFPLQLCFASFSQPSRCLLLLEGICTLPGSFSLLCAAPWVEGFPPERHLNVLFSLWSEGTAETCKCRRYCQEQETLKCQVGFAPVSPLCWHNAGLRSKLCFSIELLLLLLGLNPPSENATNIFKYSWKSLTEFGNSWVEWFRLETLV